MVHYLQFVRFIVMYVSTSTIVLGKYVAVNKNRTNLGSVFNSLHLSSLYETVRKRTPVLMNSMSFPLCMDSTTTDTICQKVLSSDYFRSKNYKLVNMEEPQIYLELLDKQLDNIRNDIFVKLSNDDKLISLFSTDNNYVYENRYHQIDKNIVIQDSIKGTDFHVENESVFTCLVRHCGTAELETFYVSKEYNTANPKNSSTQHISGRFIFQGDRRKMLTLVALAEEPAEVFYGSRDDQVALERTYIQTKKSLTTSEKEDKEVLCKRVERTRLCSSLFEGMRTSIPQYRDRFSPLEHYEPVECFKKEVSFWTDEVRNEIGKSEKFYEWMIYCEARDNRDKADPRAMVRFFVSDAWNPNHVFVYFVVDEKEPQSLSDGKAYLENLSANISVSTYD